MADPAALPLAPRSPLGATSSDPFPIVRAAGIEIDERPFLAQILLRMPPADDAIAAVGAALDLDLPPPGRLASAPGAYRLAIWMGPDEWLVVEPGAPEAVADRLLAAGRAHGAHDRRCLRAPDAARAARNGGSGRAVGRVLRSTSIRGRSRSVRPSRPSSPASTSSSAAAARTSGTSPCGRRLQRISPAGCRTPSRREEMSVDRPKEEPRFPRVTLAAVCIPWDERNNVVEDVFREQIRLHLRAGVKDLYVFGTAGEGYAVTESPVRRDRPPVRRRDVARRRGAADDRAHQPLHENDRRTDRALPRRSACGPSSSRCRAGVPLNDNELSTFFKRGCRAIPGRPVPALQPAARRPRSRPGRVRPSCRRVPELRRCEERHEQHRDAPRPAHAGAGDPPVLHRARLPAGLPRRRARLPDVADDDEPVAGRAVLRSRRRTATGTRSSASRPSRSSCSNCSWTAVAPRSAAHAFPGAKAHMDGAFEKVLAKVLDPGMPLRLLPPYQSATDAAYAEFVRRMSRAPAALDAQADGLATALLVGAMADDQDRRRLVAGLDHVVRHGGVPQQVVARSQLLGLFALRHPDPALEHDMVLVAAVGVEACACAGPVDASPGGSAGRGGCRRRPLRWCPNRSVPAALAARSHARCAWARLESMRNQQPGRPSRPPAHRAPRVTVPPCRSRSG